MRRGALLAFLAGLALAIATPVRAQEIRLAEVSDLAGMGRTEEARELLLRWWTNERDTASRDDVQRGLWLRGRLTVDPAQADLDFRRLLVEYPGGRYSDQALFRLAQAAHAIGDGDRAEALVAQLSRDYPSGALQREARAWLEAAGPAQRPPVVAQSGPPPVAPTPAGSREGQVAAPEEGRGGHAVQLGAFSSETRARALLAQAAGAGFAVRLARVEGSGLLRVRVGRFETQAGAETLLASVRAAGFTATLVDNAQSEEQVRE